MASDVATRGFVAWGEYTPDLRYLVNDGLLVADGVVPVYGNYITSPALTRISAILGSANNTAFGLFVDPTSGNGYAGLQAKLWEITDSGTVTDRSRGGNYSVPDLTSGWQGCAFGTNVVMTSYYDAVQYMVPGNPPFADMITSTFAPKARYVFPLRNNLFLANCSLAAPFDTLSSGANPVLVAWSQTDNIRQFGSFNATPALVGTGYQALNYDVGEITGGIGGNGYGIVTHANGVSRVDGPPYQFRLLHKGLGCFYPNALVIAGDDFYYFSPAGLTRIAGGDGPPEVLGDGKWIRSLIDNVTGAGAHPAIGGGPAATVYGASMAFDPINNLIFVAYTSNDSINLYGGAVMVYNISEDRAAYFQLSTSATAREVMFLRAGRQGSTSDWGPGRDIRFLSADGTGTGVQAYYSKMTLGNSGMAATLQRGYMQFSSTHTTRLRRVRPIYNVSAQAAIEQISVTCYSTNKPYATPTAFGPYSTLDDHGFIVMPTTKLADFHSLKFTMAANANMHKVIEYEGFEYDIEVGGGY